MSALDTLEEIKNMKPLDKLVRKYMWGHHVNGTFYFHGDPKLDEARKELADLRTRIEELEKRNREIESYHLNHLGIPCDMTDPDIAVLQARIAELEADALARLIEEPTNERIMKDVYEENERLQKAVEETSLLIEYIKNGENKKAHLQMLVVESCLEYGGKE